MIETGRKIGQLTTSQSSIQSTSAVRAAKTKARAILTQLLEHRRMAGTEHVCDSKYCQTCLDVHLDKVTEAIVQSKPIQLVLPAFPGKSPNLGKVLGPLPDMAELLSLKFLNQLCKNLSAIYSPGVFLVICSDGRVFSDVVGMKEKDVTDYQNEIQNMIDVHEFSHLSTFNLDEWCEGENFDQVRLMLLNKYGQSLEQLRAKVKRGGIRQEANSNNSRKPTRDEIDSHRLYCGITRFLFEDSIVAGETRSRTAVQKDCRKRAYEVIRRSNAWSEVIAGVFPEAVRLSIHPQTCGSKKLGIKLLGNNPWMTPWHGVAVDTGDGYVLMKRSQAEKLAEKVHDEQTRELSHFQITGKNRMLERQVC